MRVEIVLFVCGVDWQTGEVSIASISQDRIYRVLGCDTYEDENIITILDRLLKRIVKNIPITWIKPFIVENYLSSGMVTLVYGGFIPLETTLIDGAKWFSSNEVYNKITDKNLQDCLQLMVQKVRNYV